MLRHIGDDRRDLVSGVRAQSRLQAGAARRAGRGLRVPPPEQHTLPRRVVRDRGLEAAVAERRGAVAPPLARGHEKDVARHRHGACGCFVGLRLTCVSFSNQRSWFGIFMADQGRNFTEQFAQEGAREVVIIPCNLDESTRT